jgi:hypothetical protein
MPSTIPTVCLKLLFYCYYFLLFFCFPLFFHRKQRAANALSSRSPRHSDADWYFGLFFRVFDRERTSFCLGKDLQRIRCFTANFGSLAHLGARKNRSNRRGRTVCDCVGRIQEKNLYVRLQCRVEYRQGEEGAVLEIV